MTGQLSSAMASYPGLPSNIPSLAPKLPPGPAADANLKPPATAQPNDIYASANPQRDASNAAATNAAGIEASAQGLGALLKQALNEKLGGSSIPSEQGTAAANLIGTLGSAPDTVTQGATGMILSPTQQAAIIAGREKNALAPLVEANSRYNLNTGTIADIINAAGGQANRMSTLANSAASLSEKNYQDALDRITKNYQLTHTGGGTANSNLAEQSVAQDAASGMSLNDIIAKYKGNSSLSATAIASIYKQYATSQQAVVTPIKSTINNQTTVTGMTVKTSDGFTHTVVSGPKHGPFSLLGIGDSSTKGKDPIQMFQDAQGAGYTVNEALQLLEQAGFQVN